MSKNKFIIVVGSASYGNPFVSLGNVTNKAKLLLEETDKIKAVVFTGGEDVSPYLYKGRESKLSFISERRDATEERIFELCIKHNIKMLGICRGFQFLNVMSGGKMFQHVNKHAGSRHKIYYPALEKLHIVNSLHHQMVMLPEDAVTIGWSIPNMCSVAYDENGLPTEPPVREIEAAIFPKYNAVGVQFHPEMMLDSEEARIFYIKMMGDFIKYNINDFINKYGYAKEKMKCLAK